MGVATMKPVSEYKVYSWLFKGLRIKKSKCSATDGLSVSTLLPPTAQITS